MSTENNRTYTVAGTAVSPRPLEAALYLVATPIGNLGDITLRALETLAAADILACEDTRVTRVLLNRFGIRQKPVAYHEHNAAEAGPRLIEAMTQGKSVALASDAGTPLISDPGFRLVEAARKAGICIVPIPGPSSVIAALTASGLPSDSFFFAGFLPVKDGQRRTRLTELAPVPGTLILFESPRRLASSLVAMAETLGDRQAAICRELTKAFEEIRSGSLSELAAHYTGTGAPKGEIVVCIAPPEEKKSNSVEDIDRLLLSLANEMGASKAATEAANMTGGKKSDLYRRLLDLKDNGG